MSARAQLVAPECSQRQVLCTIARMVYPNHIRDHPQDAQTYLALSRYLHRIYVLAVSRDGRTHVSRVGRVVLVCLPQGRWVPLNYLRFSVAALRLGWRLYRRSRVGIFAASEPVVAGPIALLLSRLTGRPLVVHLLGQLLDLPVSDLPAWRVVTTRKVSQFVARRGDRVRCVSHAVLESAERAGIRADRLVYLPMRVDTTYFSPQAWQADGQAVRQRFGLGSAPTILFLGTLSIHKGLCHLIRAAIRIVHECPEARVLVVGSGPLEDELRGLAVDLGLRDRVIFAGRASYGDVPAFLAAGDLLVLPSLNEGLPRVVLEAMAMERPVVASRVGGIPEVVRDGETGLLVPPRDEEALADALIKLLRDSPLCVAMGSRARQAIQAEYGIEDNIARFAHMLLTARAAGPARGEPTVRHRKV